MNNTNTTTMLKGADIQNLVTKFYYKDNHLCFQILLQCDTDNTIAYQEYSDYAEYKNAFNQLIDMRSNNESINIPQSKKKMSYMSLA